MEEQVERKLLAVQIADRIEAEIGNGTWHDSLPGNRTLAERYSVNRKTSSTAMQILEQRGVVGHATTGKRRPILSKEKAKTKASPFKAKRLLILQPLSEFMNFEDQILLMRAQEIWEHSAGDVAWASVDYVRYSRPGRMLDTLIERHSADAIVMMMPGLGWSAAALERRPCFQFGGAHKEGTPVSVSGCIHDVEIERLTNHLAARGHERIIAPVGVSGGEFQQSTLRGLQKGLGGKTPELGNWEDYCPVFPEAVPEAWTGYWERAFKRTWPTAVIVTDDTHLLSLYGYCQVHGIRIPQDLSVVSMNYEKRFEWCVPKPTMARFPMRKSLSHFKSWLANGLRPVGKKFLPLEIVKGESVGPPPMR